ncbi:hypothetical protein CGZ91_05365 [Parenemella sanctibonifatiensis]|uniref:Uncharacterized protein n=2 Tax=Parenemella sanctibonifatiensis TaxID=2016505 RepID=A0A255EH95_9ACTN|nr:hypothetical protein CGZ91_05365 [Parenemella sanctibonifatiensis]
MWNPLLHGDRTQVRRHLDWKEVRIMINNITFAEPIGLANAANPIHRVDACLQVSTRDKNAQFDATTVDFYVAHPLVTPPRSSSA